MFDLLIKNGTVVDGTGARGAALDIAVEKDKIAVVDNVKDAKAARIIDASGKVVCPGFIDILDHSDSFWTLFTIPRLDSKVMQGVTTIIGGNCGSSLAPAIGENSVASIQKWVDISNVHMNWDRVSTFLVELRKKSLGINFGTLVGHETLRRGMIGDNVRKITEQEIQIMGKMLQDSLDEGVFGMSTGLVFSHAKMASMDEIKYLAEILKRNNAFYASHIRGESEELLPSINEVIQLSRELGMGIEISHLKAVGKKYWPDMHKALEMINIANEENVSIGFDLYPYDATGSVLYILLPDWVTEGGRKKMIAKLKDPDLREKIIGEMKEMNYQYENIMISICPKMREVVGKRIVDMAQKQESSPEETVIELLISANGHVIVLDLGIISEENIKLALASKYSIVASGDAAYNIEYVRTGEVVHPRCFGTFPRILGKYVREEKVLTLENAIEKMTSLPAKRMGIKNRGVLKKDNFADIVVFDPNTVKDIADYKNPYRYSEGIEYVFVNGKMAVEKGLHTDELAGKVLRKS